MTALDPSVFISQHCYGILSTHSLAVEGYPFGSLVPYIIDSQGHINLLLSELAEHTKNIQANNKVCLTISDVKDPEQANASARISCLAQAKISSQQSQLRRQYRQQFNDAETILALPGFTFYQLDLTAIRLIAGFGKIQWLAVEQLVLQP